MPDIFVPLDTSSYTPYLRKLVAKGIVNKISTQYIDKNRNRILDQYKTLDNYIATFTVPQEIYDEMISAATKEKIEFNQEQFDKSKSYLNLRLKALFASDLWEKDDYFKIANMDDPVMKKAIEILRQPTLYDKILQPALQGKK